MGNPSDPILNCILEICCGAANAEEALEALMVDEGVTDAHSAMQCICKHFDLSTKGSLKQLKADYARLAKA